MTVFPDYKRVSMSLLNPVLLRAALGDLAAQFEIEARETCASTNAVLLERADAVLTPGALAQVLVADRQTAGRGRRGRVWVSSPEESLTFSVLWPWRADLAHLAGLSLALGLALARGLESLGFPAPQLKWPNDLLYDNAKLAGILVELSKRPQGMALVMGIGLNLYAPSVMEECAVAGLADHGVPLPPRHLLLAALLASIARHVRLLETQGFAALRTEWMARHVWQGQAVCLYDAGRLHAEGICRGVDAGGALLLETSAGVQSFLAGDLSLRNR